MLKILSLGAGVQSSTLLLMAARGELGEMPDHAIFADTGWEPQGVYDWLDYLEEQTRGIIPIHRVSKGNIRESFYKAQTSGKRYVTLPVFVKNPKGTAGMGRRQCTKEYKIVPIEQKVRELLGLKKGQVGPKTPVVEQWIGISLDEVIRMKESRTRWIKMRWPLIERRMDRRACLKWFEENGLPLPPKSACLGCPFHSDTQWREIRENPEEWADVVAFDKMIRKVGPRGDLIGENYLHRSLKPLDEVDFRTDEELGQGDIFDGFAMECEGMCGV